MADELDLDALLGTAPATPVATAPVAQAQPAVTEVKEVDPLEQTAAVDDNADNDFIFAELPNTVRAGGFQAGPRGSKYGFDKFPAPQGDKVAQKLIKFSEDKDANEKLLRSVQSAVTAANRSEKKNNTGKVFKTRTDKAHNGVIIARVA